jgi:Ca-activated chloride channel family protein
MWKEVSLKQILLITDGCSNVGEDPVTVAETARRYGIAVNVIGILEAQTAGSSGLREVREIAEAGGGASRIVELHQLAQTMHMMTRQTMHMTIHQVVNRELQSIVGKPLEDLSPDTRAEVAQMVDRAGEEAELCLVLLIDVSASMNDKLTQVRTAIEDLEIGLNSRKGKHQVAVAVFPARDQAVKVISHFCEKPGLSILGASLAAAGGTPTGPALEQAIRMLVEMDSDHTGELRNYVV